MTMRTATHAHRSPLPPPRRTAAPRVLPAACAALVVQLIGTSGAAEPVPVPRPVPIEAPSPDPARLPGAFPPPRVLEPEAVPDRALRLREALERRQSLLDAVETALPAPRPDLTTAVPASDGVQTLAPPRRSGGMPTPPALVPDRPVGAR